MCKWTIVVRSALASRLPPQTLMRAITAITAEFQHCSWRKPHGRTLSDTTTTPAVRRSVLTMPHVHGTFAHPVYPCVLPSAAFVCVGGPADREAVAATTMVWKETVTSGTYDAPKKTAALYAEDGVLWGTVSEEVRDTPEQIYAYFVSTMTTTVLAGVRGGGSDW